MTRFDIFDVIEDFRRAGKPFSIATVVRTADVTSAKAGAKAAINEDGEIVGHLGGGCVQRAVRKASASALLTGDAGMISVRPSKETKAQDHAQSVQVHASGCPSGGTVDIFIEPYALPPRLIIVGDTPIGQAIAQHSRLMGFNTRVELPGTAIEAGERDVVVIATQGNGDMDAIQAALQTSAAHISMVSSRRKSDTLRQRLIAAGTSPDDVDRLNAPAGLDLGGIDPHEIAVSILAQIIQFRHSRRNSDS